MAKEEEEKDEEKEEECLGRAGQADGRPAGSLCSLLGFWPDSEARLATICE